MNSKKKSCNCFLRYNYSSLTEVVLKHKLWRNLHCTNQNIKLNFRTYKHSAVWYDLRSVQMTYFVILCTYARYGSGVNYDNEIQRIYPWLHIVFLYWIIIDQDFVIIIIIIKNWPQFTYSSLSRYQRSWWLKPQILRDYSTLWRIVLCGIIARNTGIVDRSWCTTFSSVFCIITCWWKGIVLSGNHKW